MQVENLSKKYSLRGKRSGLLRDYLGREWKEASEGEFWALKEVDFSVSAGEVLGVIGRNGSGKSTLLKIISRITPPTKGIVTLQGRVASLLEVGTGFHPELTGLENIYMNGALLGMPRQEISRQLDAIIDFSGVEAFIRQPVKQYSSGMYIRLAFSVAAHLQADILLLDEILSVGDAAFQQKSLQKIQTLIHEEGRTVLLVSHQMDMIRRFCTRCLVLEKGQGELFSEVDKAVNAYGLTPDTPIQGVLALVREPKQKSALNAIVSCRMFNEQGEDITLLRKEPWQLQVQLQIAQWNPALELSIALYDALKRKVFTIIEPIPQPSVASQIASASENSITLLFQFPGELLFTGVFSWHISVFHHWVKAYDTWDDVLSFSCVNNAPVFDRYDNLYNWGIVNPVYRVHCE